MGMDWLRARESAIDFSSTVAADAPAEQGAEQSLVAELRAGSVEAFNYVIALYHEPLYHLICRMMGNSSDAADILQDVFLKVFRAASKFEGKSSLKTWLYRIAVHEVSNHRRWWRRHKQKETSLEAVNELGRTIGSTLPDRGSSPLQQALQAEARKKLDQALASISEPYRTVILLREFDDFSYDEIAHILEVRVGTVKSRLMRGRELLRQKLVEDPELQRELRASAVEAI